MSERKTPHTMSVSVFPLYLAFLLILVLLSVPAGLRKENAVQTGTEAEFSNTSNIFKKFRLLIL